MFAAKSSQSCARGKSRRSTPSRYPSHRQQDSRWSVAALEPRLLLAGDAAQGVPATAIAAPTASLSSHVTTQAVLAQAGSSESLRVIKQQSIVFVDADIQDFDQLSDATLSDSEVVLLDSNRCGIEQITQHLARRSNVNAIHLVGHGDDGRIKLGRDAIDASRLEANANQLAAWSASMSATADVLVYGCETGRGDSGARFVHRLASLTGCDVAASTDVTGSSKIGGDWDFERVVGAIESGIAFNVDVRNEYRHVMPITIRAAGQTNDEAMQLLIDGQAVATYLNIGGDADNGVFQEYTYNGVGVSADRVSVAFIGAVYQPQFGYDQNLRIDSIVIDGTEYQTEDPSVFSTATWTPADGITPGFRQSEYLHDNGFFQYAESGGGGSTIVVTANGSDGREDFDLLIDEVVVASYDAIGTTPQEFTYTSSETISIQQVRIEFTNDVFNPVAGIDYNLTIDKVNLDGVDYETEDPSVFSTGSWRPEDGVVPGFRESETLNVFGYFQYGGVASNGSTVVVTASGDQGQENFELQLDGQTVASFNAIGTSQQDFVYQAFDTVTPDRVRVVFTNDVYDPGAGVDYNLNVDKIEIDGQVFQTEAPNVFSTGTWLPADGITPGFRLSETLHVDGYFEYAADTTPSRPIVRINAGGGSYVDSNGDLWQADDYFDGGNVFETTDAIFQTEDDTLYQSERWNQNLSYDIPVENGAYSVNLHFAEIYWEDFGQRVFDASLEGQLIEDDLDIFERARNAFFPGDDNALVITAPQVVVADGILDLDMAASIDNAKISAIELIPVDGPGVLVLQTGSSTLVAEGGSGDNYQIQLNSAPTSNVTVSLQYDSSQVNVSPSSVTFTPGDWQTPKTISLSAVNDNAQEGTQAVAISHAVSSSDGQYNNIAVPNLSVVITDDDVVPIQFNQQTVASVADPTTAAWGPDGRLYVGSTTGVITALTFNDNNQVVSTQEISTLAGLSNNNILGIAFNPFDAPNSTNIYVAHGQLFANGGSAFPETELSPYSGQVSVLSGSNFGSLTPLITGLPVSNHDHGINGMAFDNNGDLYVAVGGNTNAGIENSAIGGIPESPFAAAVLKADITTANFNGAIDYLLDSDFTPPSGLSFDAEDSQTFGDHVSVVGGLDVSVYSSGLRNPYDLVFTRSGLLYATDNGPNNGFGDVSTGPNSQEPVTGAPDELNLLTEGGYYGHPNRTRGDTDPIQNVYFSPYQPTSGGHIAPLAVVPSSTNGIDEYRSEVFGGQLNGQLVIQEYNGPATFVQLASDGQSVVNTETINGVADGLDVLMGPGGAIFGIDFAQDRVTVATPVDNTINGATAYDISIWRAPASGGAEFTIGGVNFGNLANTSVTIGGQAVQLVSVSSNRIKGVLPAFANPGGALLDVVVNSNGSTSVLENAFLPLA